jgi:peptide/nickel transport system permease protein
MRAALASRPIALPQLSRSTWAGCILLAFTCGIAIVGPFVAPHSPSELAGPPYDMPSAQFPLGTDPLGRDVLSRVLAGGRSVIVMALVATLLGYVTGGTIGLVAGYRRGIVDTMLMRTMDLLLAFPAILFLLILATGFGASPYALVGGIALIHMPQVARILRAATLEVSVKGFVEAAVARGERTSAILRREVLPNIAGTVAADAGPRFTVSVLLVAAVNFLGLGLRPPAADWALMISENRPAITIQPWAVVAPALMIALLTIGVNLLADAMARRQGTSLERKLVQR